MLFAGIDLGSRHSKIAIFEDNQLLSTYVGDTGLGSARTAEMIMDQALRGTGLRLADFANIVSTGYGRVVVPFAARNVSDILAHALGNHWFFPSCRTILDFGGQDMKAINVDERGRITAFAMNDKCASGNGRFLETMSDLLEIPLDAVGEYSLSTDERIKFSSICAVFAKSEALSMVRKGRSKAAIMAGIHGIIGVQARKLLDLIEIKRDLALSGGVAKNAGVVARIREDLDLEPLIAPDPQIVGSVGAAVAARQTFLSRRAGGRHSASGPEPQGESVSP